MVPVIFYVYLLYKCAINESMFSLPKILLEAIIAMGYRIILSTLVKLSGPVHVGFVVHKVKLGQFFLRLYLSSSVAISPPVLLACISFVYIDVTSCYLHVQEAQ
jgi:hypothetical protein